MRSNRTHIVLIFAAMVTAGCGYVAHAMRPCFVGCPSWFAAKPLKEYEIWAYANDPDSNFMVLIDRETGNIFLADYQV
jgi:hypothetical protein